MKKLTKAERVAQKKEVKAKKVAEELANRKVVDTGLSKKQTAEKNARTSLKTYLMRKAVHKAEKLQYRAAKRNGTLPQQHEHVHTADCNHGHDHAHVEDHLDEEPIVIHEDDLTQVG
jgi:hypothetical protein